LFTENSEILSKYINLVNKISPICDEEFKYLYKKIQKGDEKAKKRLIEGNFKLVIMVAIRYQNMGLTLMDLIEEGNIGVMKAIEKYDKNKGAKFSTYAIWWIKQRIKRALYTQSYLIRVPSYAIQNVHRCANYWGQILKHGDNKDIDISQTSKDLDLTLGEVKNALYSINIFRSISSLDAPLNQNEHENINLADIIEDKHGINNPEKILEKKMDLKFINDIFKNLDKKERIIIEARFGLNSTGKKTLTNIGNFLGLSRERVRQIANIAIEKMRNTFEKDYL
jgi:RNA polymerase sigma factor (sigma-70 family)